MSKFETDISNALCKKPVIKPNMNLSLVECENKYKKLKTGNVAEKMREIRISSMSKEEYKSQKLRQPWQQFLDKHATNYGKNSKP